MSVIRAISVRSNCNTYYRTLSYLSFKIISFNSEYNDIMKPDRISFHGYFGLPIIQWDHDLPSDLASLSHCRSGWNRIRIRVWGKSKTKPYSGPQWRKMQILQPNKLTILQQRLWVCGSGWTTAPHRNGRLSHKPLQSVCSTPQIDKWQEGLASSC